MNILIIILGNRPTDRQSLLQTLNILPDTLHTSASYSHGQDRSKVHIEINETERQTDRQCLLESSSASSNENPTWPTGQDTSASYSHGQGAGSR